MGKLSADGINAQAFVNYPKGWYRGHVKGASVQYTNATGATMVVMDVKPDEGEFIDAPSKDLIAQNPGSARTYIMVNGMSKAGDPLRTDRYFDLIDALQLRRDYTCCGQLASNRPFIVKKEDGKYYCPHCGQIAKADIDVNE